MYIIPINNDLGMSVSLLFCQVLIDLFYEVQRTKVSFVVWGICMRLKK